MIHKYPHEITLIPVGPLTNIALAVSKDPSIAALVKNIVIMGGSISGGNVNGAAEANIYNDPEAAQIVFQCRLDGDDGRLRCGRANVDHAEISRGAAVVPRTAKRLHREDCRFLFDPQREERIQRGCDV